LHIRHANTEDIPKLRLLWQSFFKDSNAYLDLYFLHRFRPEFTPVLIKNDDIIGMIHMLPCMLAPTQKAFYWYAVGIRENERGRGYFRDFLKFVLEKSQGSGFHNVCVPVSGLEGIYQKYGFTHCYTAVDMAFTGSPNHQIRKAEICNALPSDFLALSAEQGSTLWDLSAISYAFLENSHCNGKQIKISFRNRNYLAFAMKKDDHYLIDYTNLNFSVLTEIQNQLMTYLNCKKRVLRMPSAANEAKTIALSDSKLVTQNSQITMTLS